VFFARGIKVNTWVDATVHFQFECVSGDLNFVTQELKGTHMPPT
jgi:hypothetical protein